MKTKSIYNLLLALLVVLGCSKSEPAPAGMGSLTIQLTDAPFPHDMVAEANVTIFKVEARYKGEDENDEDHDGNTDKAGTDDDSGSFIVLMEEEITVNLLDLTNGVTETLVDIDIPAGVYDLFRVYVRDANIVLNDEDNTTFQLNFPSGESSGVKIFIKPPLVVTTGLSADLLFDFDVCSSFVPRGKIFSDNFNGFNFKPVIKVSNLTTAGTLQGGVSTLEGEDLLPLDGAQITVMREGEVVTTTFSGENGGYVVMGLDPGMYQVMVELTGFESQTVESVQISAGNYTSVDFELIPSE
ncbi:Carboxypeptidase regulatory-like domain-containing protein [Muriicola jejuensis]|uniref:DUF4382 domain-containing protein n=1 Tax=Muriicola jejuensis TaxID=504488 RepID=A0A6P0UHK2_9FLAO|nr:DUF4382 domain-containing protein [Muriicola jejuensis]NER11298.1 DUF4382 domain-containing protein [Muriicola jejuensis]SMP21652.1 Carboxypeptidase regulatory-like domain-containing protein [Muriicola jejuensis]